MAMFPWVVLCVLGGTVFWPPRDREAVWGLLLVVKFTGGKLRRPEKTKHDIYQLTTSNSLLSRGFFPKKNGPVRGAEWRCFLGSCFVCEGGTFSAASLEREAVRGCFFHLIRAYPCRFNAGMTRIIKSWNFQPRLHLFSDHPKGIFHGVGEK